jgi:hypothetical protein
MALSDIPVLVEFVPGTSLYRERERVSQFPILRNGPAGTFVVFPDGLRVSLPTDQLVYADDTGGCARVGFGGMDFCGCDDGRLAFIEKRRRHNRVGFSVSASCIRCLASNKIGNRTGDRRFRTIVASALPSR